MQNAANSRSRKQHIEWLGLSFSVPEDWQVVRHGLSPSEGSLVLIDRRRQRLTVSWAACKNEPNLKRLLRDYQGKQREQGGATEFESLTLGAYRGFSHTGPKGERLFRLVRYHAEHQRLLELLWIEPEGSLDREGLRALLQSVRLTAKPSQCQRWTAFGIDVETPPHFRLARAVVNPADVSFEFVGTDSETGEDTKTEARVRRLGMAAAWYEGDLVRLVEKHAPKVRFRQVNVTEHQGFEAVELEGTEPGPPAQRLLRLLRTLRILAFHCPEENAVYELSTTSPRKRPLAPDTFSVHLIREVS